MNWEYFAYGAVVGAVSWMGGNLLKGFINKHDRINKARKELANAVAIPTGNNGRHWASTEPTVRIGVVDAINGKLLEVVGHTINRHGDKDYNVEYYIIDTTKPLSEEIAVVMLMKGMSK